MFALLRKSVQVRKRLTAAKNALWPSAAIDDVSEVLWSEERRNSPWDKVADVPELLKDQVTAGITVDEIARVRRFEGNMTVDPLSGLLFSKGRVVWNSTDVPERRERTPMFLRHRMSGHRQFDAIASLHHIFDNNYYHFFNNIAVKLPLFAQAGVPDDIPLLVSQRLAGQPFFRDARGMGLFGDREIIVQKPREVIAANTVYTAHGFAFLDDQSRFDWLLDRLGVEHNPAGDRRIFIHRGPRAINRRQIRNQDDLDRLLARYGIEKLDPQELDLAGQASAFAAARLIVGAHGAGLTNMIFRRRSPLDLIELFNPNFINPCYCMMAGERGYAYRCQLNSGLHGSRWTNSAEVHLDGLERLLDEATSAATMTTGTPNIDDGSKFP